MAGLVATIEGDRLTIAITPTPDGIHGGKGSATKTLIQLIHRATQLGHQVAITRDRLTIVPPAPAVPTVEELGEALSKIPEADLISWRNVFLRDADHIEVRIEGGEGSDRPARLVIRPLDTIGALLLAQAHE